MYNFHPKLVLISIIAFVIFYGTGNEVLVRKGWYRISHKGPKTPIANITHIDDHLVNATDYLRVSGKLVKLHPGSIRNLPLVSTLKMTFCGTQKILAGAFQNLTNLATLALSDNEIVHVPFGVFNRLNITVLFLQRNEIETIDSAAFDDMPNLYRIKMNSNRISAWDNNWFKNTPKITELFFRRNNITEIPSNAFKNIKGSHFSNDRTTVDTKIYLSKNKISAIDPDAFQDFKEFSQLWLDRNDLEILDDKMFRNLIQVGGIYMGRNRISKIPEALFPNSKTEVLTLDLSANNNISCIPYNVVSKVKLTNLQSVRKLDCDCIRAVIEKVSIEKKDNVIKCKCYREDI